MNKNPMKATVTGLSSQGKNVEFKLPKELIIHIRRIAHRYESIFPDIEINKNHTIIELFKKFGKFNTTGIKKDAKNNYRNRYGNKCFKCGSVNNLTFDHIIKKREGGKIDNGYNLRLVCRKCHDIIELQDIIELKKKEIEKLEEKLRDG